MIYCPLFAGGFMSTPPEKSTQDLLRLIQEEQMVINTDIQAEAVSVCEVLAQVFVRWQEKSGTIRDLSFSGADIINQTCNVVYHFLNKEDEVPLRVKVALCRTAFGSFSMPYLETSHRRIKPERIEEKRPNSVWERRRWRLRFQAHDLVMSQLPLLYQTLGQMGYAYYANQPVTLSSWADEAAN